MATAPAKRAHRPSPTQPPATVNLHVGVGAGDELESIDTDPVGALVEQFGGDRGYRVRLNRMNDKGKPAYITTMEFTPELLEEVKSVFGGGRYQARLVDSNYQFVKNGTTQFTIDGPPIVSGPVTTGAPPAAAGPLERAPSVDQIVTAVLERIEPRSQRSSGLDVVALIAALSPIVLELIKGGRPRGVTAEDVRAIVTEVATKSGATNATADLIGAVKQILEVRELLTPDGGGSDAVAEGIRTFGPILQSFLGQQPPAGAPAPSTHQLEPGPAPASTPAATESTMSKPEWMQELAPHVTQLVRIASEAGDPRQLATGIQFFMTARHKGMLRELVSQPDAHAQLIGTFAPLAAYPGWLEDFIDEVRSSFGLPSSYDDEDDDTAVPPSRAKA